MLRKLLKYELKATARVFLPLYIVLFSFATVNRLLSSLSILEWQTPQAISMTIYIIILVGMFIVTFIMMLQRFYKNLLSDEGYLMFTLPAKPWKHILSKLLVSMLWIAASGIAAVISILIISADRTAFQEFLIVVNFIFDFLASFGASAILFLLEILLVGIIGLASGVLIIYASIAIGHLFNRHRIFAAVGAFIALSTINQMLFVTAGSVLTVFSFPEHINNFQDVEPFIHLVLWYIIGVLGFLTAGYFVVTNYILSKRLNLE